MSQHYRLAIRKIIALDDDDPVTKEATIHLDSDSSVLTLRNALVSNNIMSDKDAFMLPSDPYFALAKLDEEVKGWKTVKKEDNSVTVLTHEREAQETDSHHSRDGKIRGLPDGNKGKKLNGALNLRSQQASEAHSDGPVQHVSISKATARMLKNASELKEEQWRHLIVDLNGAIKGMVLGTASVEQDPGPREAPRALIDYTTNLPSITRSVSDSTTKDDIVMNSERNHKYVKSGWINATLDVTTPYAAASLEAKRTEDFSKNIVKKTIYVTNTHVIRRAKVQFDPTKLTLSQEFHERLDASLQESLTDDQKRNALNELFETYGHVFPVEMVLGGKVVQSSQHPVSKQEEIDKKTKELSASLNAYFVKAGAGFGNTNEASSSTMHDNSDVHIKLIGGDTTLDDDRKQWVDTVKDYDNWRIVSIDRVVRIADLPAIDSAQRETIARLAPPKKIKALRGRWINNDSQRVPDGVCKELSYRTPGIRDPEWFWLGQTKDNRVLVVQERIPGSLCKIDSIEPIWDSKGRFPLLKTVTYLGNPVPEQDATFAALGSCVYSKSRLSFGNDGPDLKSRPWSKLRAVRQDLLVVDDYKQEAEWKHTGKHGTSDASVWSIQHKGTEPTIELDSFKAIAGHEKESVVVYRLREDEIEMETQRNPN